MNSRVSIFGFLRRDPLKLAEKQYAQKLEAARDAQRKGDMALFAALTAESEQIAAEIDRLAAPSMTL